MASRTSSGPSPCGCRPPRRRTSRTAAGGAPPSHRVVHRARRGRSAHRLAEGVVRRPGGRSARPLPGRGGCGRRPGDGEPAAAAPRGFRDSRPGTLSGVRRARGPAARQHQGQVAHPSQLHAGRSRGALRAAHARHRPGLGGGRGGPGVALDRRPAVPREPARAHLHGRAGPGPGAPRSRRGHRPREGAAHRRAHDPPRQSRAASPRGTRGPCRTRRAARRRRCAVDDDAFQYCVDLGLLVRDPAGVRVANPLYREVAARELSLRRQENFPLPWWPWQASDGSIDMPALVDSFLGWWRENAAIVEESTASSEGGAGYVEAVAQLAFMGFLQKVVNGGGRVTREYAAGRGAIDLLVEFGPGRHVVELKRVPRRHDRATRPVPRHGGPLRGVAVDLRPAARPHVGGAAVAGNGDRWRQDLAPAWG